MRSIAVMSFGISRPKKLRPEWCNRRCEAWNWQLMVPDSSGQNWMFLISDCFDFELYQVLDYVFMKKTAPLALTFWQHSQASSSWGSVRARLGSTEMKSMQHATAQHWQLYSGWFMPHIHCVVPLFCMQLWHFKQAQEELKCAVNRNADTFWNEHLTTT